MSRHKPSLVPVDQIQQRKQINPDNVDEVPVQATDFDRSVVLGSEASLPGSDEEPKKNSEPDNHVQGVQAGHHEVQRKKQLRMFGIGVLTGMPWNLFLIKTEGCAGDVVLDELVFVLDALDAEKGETEQHSDREGDQ